MLATALLLVLAVGRDAQAQSTPTPATCKLGAFVTSLHEIDTTANQFSADMWLWSVCPDAKRKPLDTLEIVNAAQSAKSLDSVTTRPQGAWAQTKVSGAFRTHFDLRNYPFDRHQLVISLEEGVEDASQFVYTPDLANSRIDPSVRLEGWKIANFALRPRNALYPTSFGDPALGPGASANYSRLDLVFNVVRDQATSFIKLTIPLYAAAALALVSLLMHTESDARVNPRIAFLGGAMLTVVINMRSIDDAVGYVEGVSLLDMLHLAVLVLIVAATVESIACSELLERGLPMQRVRRIDYLSFLVGGLLYVLANIAFVLTAVAGG